MHLLIAAVLLLPPFQAFTKPDSQASFRALAATDRGVLCLSGNGPEVWISEDRGATWSNRTPGEGDVSDYRCVAIPNPDASDPAVIVASAGSPAAILRSTDFGRSWKLVYFNRQEEAFIDGLQFWDEDRGIAFGDPLEGSFLLLKTEDGGLTWTELSCDVQPLVGEAGFAASNSSLALLQPATVLIGLGGRVDGGASRILRSEDAGRSWTVHEVPSIPAGPSSGIFSISVRADGFGYAVGGNYKEPDNRNGNIATTSDGGRSWEAAEAVPRGYRSSVLFAHSASSRGTSGRWVATGPSGTDILRNGTWEALKEGGFHALHLLRDGSVLASGASGRAAILDLEIIED
ncbi:MAG: hypothetical protein AAF802_08640 [Planctomycetota bacterium]